MNVGFEFVNTFITIGEVDKFIALHGSDPCTGQIFGLWTKLILHLLDIPINICLAANAREQYQQTNNLFQKSRCQMLLLTSALENTVMSIFNLSTICDVISD